MSVQVDVFSDRFKLKELNKNFEYLIQLIQSTYHPSPLFNDESSLKINAHSLDFLQQFNGSNQSEQIHLLSQINSLHELWTFLSFNPTSYDCETFLNELYQLTLTYLSVKQHLSFHCEDFLLTLTNSYDDKLRYACFEILALLMNDPRPQSKQTVAKLNRMCYECLYDFHIYYEQIKTVTIESRIIDLTKEDTENLVDGRSIRTDLEVKINEAIAELGGLVFFKMRRSPKDAYQNLSKEIDDKWIQIWNLKDNEDPQNHFMKIQNINQLKLLFKSSSRLREDCNEISSNEKLILRQWIDYIPPEFRCFVCKGKLNAVSTYGFHQNKFNDEEQLKQFLNSKKFQKLILSIPYTHGIVDCAIDPNNFQVIIIEINPFSKRSSAGNYSWIIDRDILYDFYQTEQCINIRL